MRPRGTARAVAPTESLGKSPSGIAGLDEILAGGLPQGRPTLVCGTAGCGKTLLGVEFIVRGILDYQEPGVLVSFEETEAELIENCRSLGFDLNELIRRGQLVLDYVRVERSEIEETGEYDLEGLFVRLQHAIRTVGAKRVVLDTIESLFSGLSNTAILRSELRRLFRWLKDQGVTAVITGERGQGTLTRQGIEEYVSDCVILLDHRVEEQISTRRLRVVKYRGSTHGTNEYPFIISAQGIHVLPITSLGLQHVASEERVSTGVARLDVMLGGHGYFRGSSVLVSGTAGTGKTSLAVQFVAAACQRGEKCLYLAFEESQGQILRNMRSIGLDLRPYVAKGLLQIHAARPTLQGLEMHLAQAHLLIDDYQPAIVVVDPITNLLSVGVRMDVHAMLMRLVDYLKSCGITTLVTALTRGGEQLEQTDVDISSLIDTWILLRDIESSGERNRGLYVLKSRGMSHSNQIREYRWGPHGMEMLDVYVGSGGVLTGSARQAQETRERAEELERQQDLGRRQAEAQAKQMALEAQIAALQAKLTVQTQELRTLADQEQAFQTQQQVNRETMARVRQADAPRAPEGDGLNRRRGGRK